MRRFNITVQGKSYEVDVEEINGSSSHTYTAPATTPAPSAEPKREAAPVVATPAPTSVPADATVIAAPMPGTVLDIKVKVGDTVENGQVLVVLEAMKMENEIVAPKGGKVVAIGTTKGSSVNSGDTLVSLA